MSKRRKRSSSRPDGSKLIRSDELLAQLALIRQRRAELDELLDADVVMLRRMGVSYAVIGRAAGFSPQALHQRYRDVPLADRGS